MKKQKSGFKILPILLFALSLASCQTQKGWVYKANRWNPAEKSQQEISISPFTDDRPEENKNALLMYKCPLSPFGWQKLSTPELFPLHLNSGTWLNYDPKVDFAKALIQEIKGGTPFKDVIYTENNVDAGYRIQGRIINTDYKAKMFSYCISYFGPALWLLGLPAGSFSNELSLELTCYDSNNKVILQKTYQTDRLKKTTWIYSLRSDFEYASLLKKIYSDFIKDFNKAIN